MDIRIVRAVFVTAAVLSALSPMPAVGLVVGVVFAQLVDNPFAHQTKKLSTWTLQASVVLLGFAMNLYAVLRAGRDGATAALVGITLTLLLGRAIGSLLRVPSTTSWLVSVGTAICGGSAIAACAPVLGASDEEVSASAGTVFVLNAIALFAFPPLGHALSLSDHQFGLLAALAIHDTSSVVGAAAAFSSAALEVATTVKLARALFILPMPFLLMALTRNSGVGAVKKPWFVVLFLAAAALSTFVAPVHAAGAVLAAIGKHGLSLALFFIGTGLSRRALRAVGPRPLLQGLALWLIVSTGTVLALRSGLLD